MPEKNRRKDEIPPETGRSAFRDLALPLALAIGLSIGFSFLSLPLMLGAIALACVIGFIIAFTHNTKH